MCPRPRCDFGDVKLSTQSLGMGFLFWPQMYTKMKTAPQYRTVIALLLLSVFEGSAADAAVILKYSLAGVLLGILLHILLLEL
ncbi:uncharacterized protein LOC131708140 isoform X2 [Acipenser ruthenus]|uniref:uncharacterized protein LOC131708140 isoform X2 n=1 Tax=Acipenser ruthenus TaxID=7906 RepID=UPI002741609B|nr:uncharacterized protein LOC131708140 isoform X2 [Acipenser ruthenus]